MGCSTSSPSASVVHSYDEVIGKQENKDIQIVKKDAVVPVVHNNHETTSDRMNISKTHSNNERKVVSLDSRENNGLDAHKSVALRKKNLTSAKPNTMQRSSGMSY